MRKMMKIKEGVIYLIVLSSSTSSLLQPWLQPEKANMSISYLRWSTRKGPFSLKILTSFRPVSSIWEVNLRAWKLTRHLNFWISIGSPLLATRASVLFKCTTLYFRTSGRICWQKTSKNQFHNSSARIVINSKAIDEPNASLPDEGSRKCWTN